MMNGYLFKAPILAIVAFVAFTHPGHTQASANFGRLPGPPPTVCVYDEGSPRTCIPFLSLDDATHLVTLGVGVSTPNSADSPRSLQSFGAVGDGVADDTAVVQTALNSGIPLTCRGTFKLTSLVTITNKNVFFQGASEGCTFVYNTDQTMIHASLTANGLYDIDYFTMKNVKIIPKAAITAVTGPAKTAAIYVEYPLGTAGITSPTVNIENVQVLPDSSSNYILNGIYLEDATNARISGFMYEGNRSSVNPNSSAIVYDGTFTPSALYVNNSYSAFVGRGVYAPPQAASGWQGIRIDGYDCVHCGYGVDLHGASDGLSDFVDIHNSHTAFVNEGIRVLNAFHVNLHENYVFNFPVTGIANPASPICYEITWTVPIAINGVNSNISNNTCDGNQAAGFSGRYGINLQGTSGTSMNTVVGPNTLSNLEFGYAIQANTAGNTVYPQVLRNVGSVNQLNSTAGANALIQFPIPYSKFSANASTGSVTLTAAELSGGTADVVLRMTGTLGAGANATLPTVASLVAALPDPQVGQSYRFQFINNSGGAFTWTIVTNTGWTLNNAMTVAQTTKRDFIVTLTSMTAATLQSLGQVAFTGL